MGVVVIPRELVEQVVTLALAKDAQESPCVTSFSAAKDRGGLRPLWHPLRWTTFRFAFVGEGKTSPGHVANQLLVSP